MSLKANLKLLESKRLLNHGGASGNQRREFNHEGKTELKRIAPTWIMRTKAGLPFGVKLGGGLFFTVLVAIVGLVSAAGKTVPLTTSVLYGGGLSFIVGIVGAYFKGQLSQIPDLFVDDQNAESPYGVELCPRKRLEEACELTRPSYRSEYVPPEIAEQWRLKNDVAFVDIVNNQGELCACFGLLALEKSFLKLFLDGNVKDTQLRGDDVCTYKDSRHASWLYISGVVVRDANAIIGGKRAKVMIWAMLDYVLRYYGLRKKRTLFAVAVNDQSNRLLKRLGFTLAGNKNGRADKCNLYTYELTRLSWQSLLDRVGDHSKLCNMKF